MYDITSTIQSLTIAKMVHTGLNGAGKVQVEQDGAFRKVCIEYDAKNTRQDDTFVCITPSFEPNFWWSPHLTPQEGYVAQQHIFRTPALIACGKGRTLIVIPDVRLAEKSTVPWYLDMNAPERKLYVGMSCSEVREHVLFAKIPGAEFDGKIKLAFYVFEAQKELDNPFRVVLDFYWTRMGRRDSDLHLGHMKDLSPYVEHTYHWAFKSWKDVVWQDITINGKSCGAPCFIVNVTQSPNYKGEVNEREMRSVWNQAWFNSLRSATGLFRYARRTNNNDLMNYAMKTKELALAFPQKDGLFDSVIATEMELVEISEKKYNRSKGWDTAYFANSNRNPYTRDIKKSPKHILDMAFTCYYMLVWYTELEKDERLLDYAVRFADRVIKMQDIDGFYPAWVDENGVPFQHLNRSPESAMVAAYLFHLYGITRNEKYLYSAKKAMQAISTVIIPAGQWEDFETYWSCSRFYNENVGQRIERNDMFKQCSFSMYFTALAFMEGYTATNDRQYLSDGVRVLDEMLMLQSSYQPANLPIPVVGGFGVMNADGELNDSRQSLFAPLILAYGEVLDCNEYRERGIAALRAGFSMMYCPENPHTKVQWEQKWSFFGEEDYGFMMENYGHSAVTGDGGIGIGVFTIYDWGNGAASEAWETTLDRGYQTLP